MIKKEFKEMVARDFDGLTLAEIKEIVTVILPSQPYYHRIPPYNRPIWGVDDLNVIKAKLIDIIASIEKYEQNN